MSEKRTIILSYEYDKSADGICETFGLSTKDLSKFIKKCVSNDFDKVTESIFHELEQLGEDAGSYLMAMASSGIATIIMQADNPMRGMMSRIIMEMLMEGKE